MANWNPRVSGSEHVAYKACDGVDIMSEQVSFIPDITIQCQPPFVKGKPDNCWVKYRRGERPKTKEGWERALGMRLQTML